MTRPIPRAGAASPGPARRTRATAAVALLALAGAGAVAPPASAIVGGAPAAAADVPWVVQVAGPRPGSRPGQFCTGSLIRPRVVLTAAHCVEASPRTVVVGRQSTTGTDGHIYPVRSAAADPAYRESQRNPTGPRARDLYGDVGLLELREPVADVVPVALAGPADAALLFPDARPVIAGWGLESQEQRRDDAVAPRRLNAVAVPVRSARWCVANMLAENGSSHGIACLGRLRPTPPVGACNGDSGGPVFAATPTGPKQLAVTSEVAHQGCGVGRTYAVKVLSGAARRWIDGRLTPEGGIRGGTLVR